jgi:hypothetical protein
MLSSRESLIIIGWFISLLISFHAFKRSEVYRAKDKIIDRIDKIHEWIVKEIKSIKNDETQSDMLNIIESFAASKLTQLELTSVQYNKFIEADIVDLQLIAKIRCIDFINTDIQQTINQLNESVYNLSESIEINFSTHSNDRFFTRLGKRYNDVKTVFFVLLSLWLFIQILDLYF